NASHYRVDGRNHIDAEEAKQSTAQYLMDGSVKTVPLPSSRTERPVLADEDVLDVARLVGECEKVFGRPQDIEWAICDNTLWLLQSRAITTAREASGQFRLWDNSNIAESYSGVTTPLTYSFARFVYEGVYRQFLSILGVADERVHREDTALKTMLGLHAGQIYYNLNSWYTLLALLPGFKFNRSFMEQMMGVAEGLPKELAEQLSDNSRWGRLKDAFSLLKTCLKLFRLYFQLSKRIVRFNHRFDKALHDEKRVEELDIEQTLAFYRRLEHDLLPHWDAPLINDFFAMIFVGILSGLCRKWLNDPHAQVRLLASGGGIISAEPAERIDRMAALMRGKKDWIDRLSSGDNRKISQALASFPELNERISSYLEKFSDRCLAELKLESSTLSDDPSLLYRAIASQAQKPVAESQENQEDSDPGVCGLPFLKRALFQWVLTQARNRVRDRENLRFERTRLFGKTRKLFLNMADYFVDQRVLDDRRDVFYLEVHEVLGAIEGTSTLTELNGLAKHRKELFASYRKIHLPNRFETRGPVITAIRESRDPAPEHSDKLQGTGACPGIVEGRVRVVTDPQTANLEAGEILVARQTDPGWVMLFPMASGLLVERGSLLSHSAIVARELNLPAVVSVPLVTTQLKTGDRVMLNGKTGEVWKRTEKRAQ
ncbi:MAG: phosphoenolpyruvate synthase, partial [Okeania sp. SIO3C4]|nr:phosphoenolpyruvate synthase [Okeania sp. SIO3C4]